MSDESAVRFVHHLIRIIKRFHRNATGLLNDSPICVFHFVFSNKVEMSKGRRKVMNHSFGASRAKLLYGVSCFVDLFNYLSHDIE